MRDLGDCIRLWNRGVVLLSEFPRFVYFFNGHVRRGDVCDDGVLEPDEEGEEEEELPEWSGLDGREACEPNS